MASSSSELEGFPLVWPTTPASEGPKTGNNAITGDAAGGEACGTCFVPLIDLAPDLHGTTVNAFGSIGDLDSMQSTPIMSTPLIPVLMKATSAPEQQASSGNPQVFRGLLDCPTCFVPSTDLS